jgi:hypothetical protein
MENKVIEMIRQASEDDRKSKIYYFSLWPRNKRFEVSYNGFTNFINNICSCIFSTIEEKKIAYENAIINQTTYDATLYGYPFAEEAVENRVPIMINMKFKISDHEVVSIYGPRFIYICTSLIQQAIVNHFEVSVSFKELYCFILETDIWSGTGSDFGHQYATIRFHFPYTFVDIDYLNNVFIPYVISDFTKENILHHLTVTPVISLKEIILPQDKVVCMHGCKLSQKEPPLCLTTILNFIDYENIPINDIEVSEYTINLANSSITPYEHSFFTKGLIDSSIIDENILFWIPLILSVHFTTRITPILNTIVTRIPTPSSVIPELEENNIYTEKHKLHDLLSMISTYRINQKNFWYDIGRCIHNIYKGENEGCRLWKNITTDIEFQDSCEEEYSKFQDEYFDCRTIAGYAKFDSPEQYASWHETWIEGDLIGSLSCNHVPVAKVVYKTLWLNYIYDPVCNEWFHFTQNYLKIDNKSLDLLIDLTETIIPLYLNLRKKYHTLREHEKNPGVVKAHEETIKAIGSLLKKLETITFRKSIVETCREYFKDDHFNSLADENIDTMSWRNGVSECYDGEITFRGGKIQDYITKNTKSYYPTGFDDHNPKLRFMKEYYDMLYTDNELRHFSLKDQASFLQGGNPEKYFRNWIGPPNASKSQYMKIIQAALGTDYVVDPPNSIITLNRFGNSDGPNPGFEMCKGARIAFCSETSSADPLDGTKIKKMTGNDRYFNRSMREKGGTRSLTFKLIHISNVIANIPNADDAFNVREIVIPFNSQWVPNPPATREEQFRQRLFKADEMFYKKIKTHTQAQIYLMFKYFPIYKKEGLRNLPRCVLMVTLAHQQDNDPFFNFSKEKIIFVYSNLETKTRDSAYIMPTIELYAHFKRWFNSTYPQVQIMDQIRFRKEMIKVERLGPQNESNQWIGVKIRDLEIKHQ